MVPIVIPSKVLLYRTYIVFTPEKDLFEKCSSADDHSLKLTNERLNVFQTLLKYETVSIDIRNQNYEAIKQCRTFIKQRYSNILQNKWIEVHDIATYSILYTIKGSEPDLKPYLLSAHYDVVPATNGSWKHEPFGAVVDGEYIYARGTLDDKTTVFAVMEALQIHMDGSTGIADYLSKVKFGNGDFEYILDEGSVMLEDGFPTVQYPVAIIAIGEKGYLTVEYRVEIMGGHSSMPSAPTSIGILSNAMVKLEANLHPSQFGRGPELDLLQSIAPYTAFPVRLVLSNLWIFGSLMEKFLSMKPATDALQRSTTAVTMISGGVKDNVLPPSAQSTVNHRIHSGDTCETILVQNKHIIHDDRVKDRTKFCVEPSPISPYGNHIWPYMILKHTIRQTFNGTIAVVPGLTLGGTDSKSYTNLSKHLYRFSPTYLKLSDFSRFHGINERITISNVERSMNFFYHLMVNSNVGTLTKSVAKHEL
ncbi:unnamed protein product [Didymodactylos carnosus]|uniref:Peptidase M20 dimerisation domain-containing protein n=2 Tax=Didymodactylos carnosus TaxID=1234261 RepID=A0A815AV77_9BILA|nr:unnamed protein product [Didymodactylos carnosus]CAF4035519.1 unnamed protein product [Didymodactylos carnosus]